MSKVLKQIMCSLIVVSFMLTGSYSAFAQEEPVIVEETDSQEEIESNPDETVDVSQEDDESQDDVVEDEIVQEDELTEEDLETANEDEAIVDFDSLEKAIQDAPESTETILTIEEDINISKSLVISQGKNIVFQSMNNQPISLIGTSSLGSRAMVQVEAGASFTLNSDITMNCSSGGRGVHVNGTFVMNAGTITGSQVTERTGAITVDGAGASCTLNNGSVEKTVAGMAWRAAIYVKNGAKLVMNGGSVRNNRFTNQFCGSIVVEDAQFEMNGGEISNNQGSGQLNTTGGVLVIGLVDSSRPDTAKESTFVMNNGKISENQGFRGAGVYLYGGSTLYTDRYSKAHFTMNGGEISGNKANRAFWYDACGGGVFVEWNSDFTMNGGTICNNYVQGFGGGVATSDGYTNYFGKIPYTEAKEYNGIKSSDWDKTYPAAFTMNGGSIVQNQSSSCGGGVYIASNNVVLNAGDISSNSSSSQGGGVYVSTVPYTLHMTNALITGNSASVMGGGIWFCPTGDAKIYVNSGAALFDNTASGAGDDYVSVRNYPNHITTLSDRMLGGGAANWYQDGGIVSSYQLGSVDSSVPRYDAASDNNVPVSSIKDSPNAYSLKATPSENSQELAKSLATLTITGNSSQRGGGIGSNGGVVIGDTPDKTREITINKEWIGSENIPDTVKVWVVINGKRIEEVTLTKEENWTKTVTGLPVGDDISITVEEDELEDWNPGYSYETDENGNIIATIKNTYKSGNLLVSKTVSGDGADTSKEFVFTVTLDDQSIQGTYGDMTFKDGIAHFTLKHGEKKKAENLPADVGYTVTEENEDYTVTKSGDTGKIIENETVEAKFDNNKISDKKITLSVDKRWRGDNSKKRPKSITVQLYKDGKAYGDVVELSKENKWKYQWTDLDATSTWTVDEVNVPEGYTKTITHKDNAWIITNTSTDVPPTGFNSNKTMWTTMSLVSCIALLIVVVIKDKKKEEYR